MDWKRFFDGLGMNGTHWQWRMMKMERRLQEWRDSVRPARPAGAKQFKFCDNCGAMLEKNEKICPRCEAKAPSWSGWKLRRTIGLVLPSWCPVSMLIIFANLAGWLALGFFFGMKNMFAPRIDVLVRMGALVPPMALHGQWWQVITYGYLHIGLWHIGFNMFALSQVGPVIEERIGAARFFVLYTLTLMGGAFADLLLRGSVPITIAGASGALFGLIGFGVAYGYFSGGRGGKMQASFFGRWALYGFVFGFLIGADNIAHGGGFITGAAMGYIIQKEGELQASGAGVLWKILAVALAVLTVAAYVALLGHGVLE